jgi:hypothetical protein
MRLAHSITSSARPSSVIVKFMRVVPHGIIDAPNLHDGDDCSRRRPVGNREIGSHFSVPQRPVNGPAIGAGLDLACMCDLRIASESAVFAESFVKIGIIPGDGGAWLLQRVVGLSKAAEMTFTCDPINSRPTAASTRARCSSVEWAMAWKAADISRMVSNRAVCASRINRLAHAQGIARIYGNPPRQCHCFVEQCRWRDNLRHEPAGERFLCVRRYRRSRCWHDPACL